ncbi:hypothetical protein GDO81_023539 [Engystomops pustulosus]|uniref:Frog antimicrobial peptide propeptide domain-containing protein n=1 Tax=Engystomops pustulosus TaxID=76066 RepID=A0AAV6Z993_ENGPU|nr:hypothetical protein GDO81_023539 [Engystomops pustulosus]
MTFLKKSLFLVLFLGLVSLSICHDDKAQEEDKLAEEREVEEELNEVKSGSLWEAIKKSCAAKKSPLCIKDIVLSMNKGNY